ncbi:MAG TPA: inositol monophosphatase family protein, partial [Candidatus Tectomicrobia bacterium]|nr:inositol monophosphatase family protein [Candidatus Tectomicrobia bacterium]
MGRERDLARIRDALRAAADILGRFSPARVAVIYKGANSPVTEADVAVDRALRAMLSGPGEGWLSEESADDPQRLGRPRVWIVDPLDGTREFLEGVPEWNVSIGLAEDGVAVAGGVFNPSRDELFLGAVGEGATLNGEPITVSARPTLDGATTLMHRWALRRLRPGDLPPGVVARQVGPLAYALALVAAGRAEAVWSRSEKAEWDIAAGTAL